jgi:HEPN domain-containing protein
MKNPPEQFRRWISQAEHQVEVTRTLLESGFWSDVCFNAEQTAQMALKAYLFGKGQRFVQIHSIRELALRCAEFDEEFTAASNWGMVLDRYYITTRYPDALASPAVPFQSFSEDDARQAYGYAVDIVQLVRAWSEQQ